jgi:hypothetical protein
VTEPGTGRERAWWDDVEADIAAAVARDGGGDHGDDDGDLPDPWGAGDD